MAEFGYIRAIFSAGRRVWGTALVEILVISVVSVVPLLIAAFRQVLPLDSKVYLSDAFEKSFLSGQLIFYALGLIAMVVWRCNKDMQFFQIFRSFFNLYSILCIAACSMFVSYDPELHDINRVYLGPFSVVVFVTSMIAYVLMAVIEFVHPNVRDSLAERDATLQRDVRRSRGIDP
jgi:hypothetical protein